MTPRRCGIPTWIHAGILAVCLLVGAGAAVAEGRPPEGEEEYFDIHLRHIDGPAFFHYLVSAGTHRWRRRLGRDEHVWMSLGWGNREHTIIRIAANDRTFEGVLRIANALDVPGAASTRSQVAVHYAVVATDDPRLLLMAEHPGTDIPLKVEGGETVVIPRSAARPKTLREAVVPEEWRGTDSAAVLAVNVSPIQETVDQMLRSSAIVSDSRIVAVGKSVRGTVPAQAGEQAQELPFTIAAVQTLNDEVMVAVSIPFVRFVDQDGEGPEPVVTQHVVQYTTTLGQLTAVGMMPLQRMDSPSHVFLIAVGEVPEQ